MQQRLDGLGHQAATAGAGRTQRRGLIVCVACARRAARAAAATDSRDQVGAQQFAQPVGAEAHFLGDAAEE